MENINFGIDLGTTNSGIARYENGRVQILRNPVGHREILPSVVSFYKGRILVGDKAREQYLSNAGQVFSAFKRRMGTNDQYELQLADEQQTLSPIDLSALVLKELKNYLDANTEAVVITIPASFDTLQSNATKQAGYQAGFNQVILLQEPVAACLAYANTNYLDIEREQYWLVYDLGGGTFDTALVYINKRELRVVDNKGNNFLGGVDIDYAFVSQLIVPKLAAELSDLKLWDKLIAKEGFYKKLWFYLNYQAEEAKKQLSVKETTWIEIDFPELNLYTEFEITQVQFNTVLQPKYQETENFITSMLAENSLNFGDISRIILVGGATYSPYIKSALREISGTLVDDSIDPTTAVIAGAAYYAGSQPKVTENTKNELPEQQKSFDVKFSFEAYTNDLEELFAFKTLSEFKGFYRITRTDGGFDSGLIAFHNTASEFVNLMPKTKNGFKLQLFNQNHQQVWNSQIIEISHGLYSVSGQLLPEDICIELDEEDSTYLEVVFSRNSLLPLKKTLYKTFSRSILQNSKDKLIINVVEGKGGTLPGANLSIGYIELSGAQLESDLIQGTDIEIKLAIDESRGLQVEIYIPGSGQVIERGFHIARREISAEKMLLDLDLAMTTAQKEIVASNKVEAYEISSKFQTIQQQIEKLQLAIQDVIYDKATEEIFRLDEQKRQLLTQLDGLTRARDIFAESKLYHLEKERYQDQRIYAFPEQNDRAITIFEKDKEMLNSQDKHLIKRKTDELRLLNDQIYLQNEENYVPLFLQLTLLPATSYKNYNEAEILIETGHQAVNIQDYKQLKHAVVLLFNLLTDEFKSVPAGLSYKTNKQSRTGLK